jgi:hypothetical protein
MNDQTKKIYSAPVLTVFGDVERITLGSGPGGADSPGGGPGSGNKGKGGGGVS